jgi:hypothetical protein
MWMLSGIHMPNPAAIRRLGNDGRGARRAGQWLRSQDDRFARTIGRMDAIQDTRAMAGSPDAGFADMLRHAASAADSVPPSCAWLSCFEASTPAEEPMKENHHVQ